MATALFALGLVLVVEGLAWALAPSSVEAMLEALRRLGVDQRRLAGLAAIALGVALIWIARALGV
jgi:hypothetical protein